MFIDVVFFPILPSEILLFLQNPALMSVPTLGLLIVPELVICASGVMFFSAYYIFAVLWQSV